MKQQKKNTRVVKFERTEEIMKEVEAKVQFTNADDVEEFVKAAGK